VYNFEFKKSALKEHESLPVSIQKRILEKLNFFNSQENPLKFAEKIKDRRFGDYRFRVGDYRILFDVLDNKITILKVGHRRDIYK